MKTAKYIVKNHMTNRLEGTWCYYVLNAKGVTIKEIFLRPEAVKEIPEYENLQSISPVQHYNLKRHGKLTTL